MSPGHEMSQPVAQMVKNLPTAWETQVQSLGWEVPLEEEIATHSSILAWRIPWTGEPGGSHGSHSPWGQEESDTTERLHFQICIRASSPCCRPLAQVHLVCSS